MRLAVSAGSRPARGAWIETLENLVLPVEALSRPARGAWIETLQLRVLITKSMSRPARGAWIETLIDVQAQITNRRRAPHGARGLKRSYADRRDVWYSRAPHGARGLKHKYCFDEEQLTGRAPHGARGLKQRFTVQKTTCSWSRPARGAWIDTTFTRTNRSVSARGLKQDESGECQHGDAWTIARHCL